MSMNLIEKDKKYLLGVYNKYPLVFVRGEGSYVWDQEGKKYLDFYGAHAVCILGHCFKPVVEAIKSQTDKLIFYSNMVHTQPAIELAEKLALTMLPDPYKVYFANSGSEANETAIKLARKHTGKNTVISFEGAFHGRSMTNLAVTGINSYHRYNPNFDQYTKFAKLGDMASVKAACGEDSACVILEGIQSIGGINMAERDFYSQLQSFCKEQGILLIVDEVQTGLGRTGEFWFSKKLGLNPDMITSAKGIASGLPLSLVLVSEELSEQVELSDHSTTFGGGPVPSAAANVVIETILSAGFLESVKKKSNKIFEGLSKVTGVKNVLGEGLIIGIELEDGNEDLVNKCLNAGLIVGSSSKKNVIRITPPLNISFGEIEEFLTIFNAAIKQ